tara:strand:+ start:960 stop:1124 length:165 start_codon:yes stop_codon:yes gene_type:complete
LIYQSADEEISLTDINRDFKTFTSKEIVRIISEEQESRREYMLDHFEKACENLK